MSFSLGTYRGEFTVEFRVKFPGPTNDDIPPTSLSGELVTLANSSVGAPARIAVWYEKSIATSATGNIYVTSSAGKLSIDSAPIFNDDFYNISLVKEQATGSLALRIIRCEGGTVLYSTSSFAATSSVGFPFDTTYSSAYLGRTAEGLSTPQFWGQEFRAWDDALTENELKSHAWHFESYGRETSYDNDKLQIHLRLNEGSSADASGTLTLLDSTIYGNNGTGSYVPGVNPYTKFLNQYEYIPGIDYGWNQEKVRVYSGSMIDSADVYEDERFVSLEFNMYDALNEDISHVMSSYDELGRFIGLPVNRYREEYEGLQQLRETYFKRLQGQLNFRVFVDMLDFFDSSFVSVVEKLLPARTLFKWDELVVESHMLERPKYQYQLRPIKEGLIEISGSISVVDRYEDDYA